MSLSGYGDDDGGGETLADANRRKLEWLEDHLTGQIEDLEDRISDLEAENTQLRRELAEQQDNGGEF